MASRKHPPRDCAECVRLRAEVEKLRRRVAFLDALRRQLTKDYTECVRRADRLARRDEEDIKDIQRTARLAAEGNTQRQIALILDITEAAVKQRLKIARKLGYFYK